MRALEQGQGTSLSEQGGGLSEGQMQRISIARAVYSNRPAALEIVDTIVRFSEDGIVVDA